MKILVINSGSSSIKFKLFEMEERKVLVRGLVERIGLEDSLLEINSNGKDSKIAYGKLNHNTAVKEILSVIVSEEYGVIENVSEIDAVGHRIAHGGELFSESVIMTKEVIENIRLCSELAPLHNPVNLLGVEACQKALGIDVPMVAVFDTAFHQTMEPKAFVYAAPYEYYKKWNLRRYGFHGTSYKYVSNQVEKILSEKKENFITDHKMVICHLGNGASVCAIKNGKSIDTSMGLTPLEGLVMGTRAGDIDPAAGAYISKKEGIDAEEMLAVLNKKSGLLGLSGRSSDFRDISEAAENGDERAKLTLEVVEHRLLKYIGGYTAELGGLDTLVFTGGIGENAANLRENIIKKIEFLGAKLDEEKNMKRSREARFISREDSKVNILVVPTNEELMIASETEVLVK